ncbi:MAG: CPBP family glutamic-type intramembrane protease [Myxococcota bacterium]
MVLAGLIALTVRLRSGGDTLSDMGLRIDNVGATAPPILGLTTLVSLALLGVGYAAGRALTGEAIVLFLLYPLWGIAQQFLMQGIVHRRLRSAGASPGVAIVVTGAAFAALHLPDEKLTVLTWIAGTGWAWLFSRWPNAWLLGLSHGVLAALTYLLVLGSPPLG